MDCANRVLKMEEQSFDIAVPPPNCRQQVVCVARPFTTRLRSVSVGKGSGYAELFLGSKW